MKVPYLSLEGSGVEAWHGELAGKGLNLLAKVVNLLVSWKRGLKVLHGLAGLGLDLERDLDGAMNVLSHLLEVLLLEVPRGEGGSANPDASRGQSAGVTVNRVLVQADAGVLADLLDLAASEPKRAEIKQDEVVVSAISDQLVSLSHKSLGEGTGVLLDLGAVLLELWSGCLLQGICHSSNGIVVGSTLVCGEDGEVDTLLEVSLLAVLQLAEEDETSTRTTEGLVGGGGHNVTEFKGISGLLGGNEATDVCNISQEVGAVDVSDLPQTSIVPLARISTGTTDNQLRAKELRVLLKGVIVHVPSFLIIIKINQV
jgi:hypothetical protein